MKTIVSGLVLLAVLQGAAFAQSGGPTVPVEMSGTERGIILEMCEVAEWAWKRRYDGYCPILRKKFEDAVAAASQPKKDDSNGRDAGKPESGSGGGDR